MDASWRRRIHSGAPRAARPGAQAVGDPSLRRTRAALLSFTLALALLAGCTPTPTTAPTPDPSGSPSPSGPVDPTPAPTRGPVSSVSTAIEVGAEPIGLALDPERGLAYVANATDGTVSVIDLVANVVTDTIDAGTRPVRLAIDPDRRLLYVGDIGDQGAVPAGVLVVDLATREVVDTIEVGTLYGDLALDPGAERGYFISPDSDESESLQVIDTATGELAGSVTVGRRLAGPLLDVEHGYAFLTHFFGGTLYVVDLATLQVNQKVEVLADPGAALSPLTFDPVGGALYLRELEGPLHVLDSASLQTIASVPMGSGILASVGAVAVDPVAGVAYVIKDRAGEVLVIDTSTYEILDTISLELPDDGGGPGSAAVDPTTGTLYVVDRARGVVYVLDSRTAS